MSSYGCLTRDVIPRNIQKIIEHIREITRKQHTDDEIYAVLRECAMDPNETVQKLLYLDTFHEVKRRHDRKKDGLIKVSKDYRSKQDGNERHGKGDAADPLSNVSERGQSSSRIQKTKFNPTQVTRVAVITSSALNQSVKGSDSNNAQNVQPQATKNATFGGVKISGEVTSSSSSALSSSRCVVDLKSTTINEKSFSMNSTSKAPNKLIEVEKNHLSLVSETANASKAFGQSSVESMQHVMFPNHLRVPKTLKSGLIFGSIDNFALKEISCNESSDDNNSSASLESSPGNDETIVSRVSLSAQGDGAEHSYSLSYPTKKTSTLGNPINVSDSKDDHERQEVLSAPEGPSFSNVHNVENYALSLVPTMLGDQQVHVEEVESQQSLETYQHLSYFAHPISLFRPYYHPIFFPYDHYYPAIYVWQMHQFFSHNSYPQHFLAVNTHLPTVAAGFELYNVGANIQNPVIGYGPSPIGSLESYIGNEDLIISQQNENYIDTNSVVNEGSVMWIPTPGQEISTLQVNPNLMFNLTPWGHFAFSQMQVGHRVFATTSQQGHTVASSSTLLQQYEEVGMPIEDVGASSATY